jgi:hypothetical protein
MAGRDPDRARAGRVRGGVPGAADPAGRGRAADGGRGALAAASRVRGARALQDRRLAERRGHSRPRGAQAHRAGGLPGHPPDLERAGRLARGIARPARPRPGPHGARPSGEHRPAGRDPDGAGQRDALRPAAALHGGGRGGGRSLRGPAAHGRDPGPGRRRLRGARRRARPHHPRAGPLGTLARAASARRGPRRYRRPAVPGGVRTSRRRPSGRRAGRRRDPPAAPGRSGPARARRAR